MVITDRVVAITGASAGIGAATAVALAERHARVVLAARRVERLEEVAAQCRSAGGEAAVVPCDVTQRADVERLVAKAVEHFGRLDVMIANAGYGFLATVQETTEQQFDDIVAANVKGTWYAMQSAAAVMQRQPPLGDGRDARGHIIAVSSGAGRRGLPLYGPYAMTKAAQLSLVEAMRVELKDQQIYVSTVHPLTTDTEFFEVASQKSRVSSKGLGPAQSAEGVARGIVRLIRRPRPELWPVLGSRWSLIVAIAFPRLADRIMARMVDRRVR